MILLLTGCINPNGMAYTVLSDKEQRKKQYIKAIKFYLKNTTYPIVFTENSGTDISHHFTENIQSGRMECFSFQGNLEKELGKGYGECEIMEYAFNHSAIIRKSKQQRIAKITGRLVIKNIKTIVRWHTLLTSHRTTLCAINSDLSFPDSRFVIASLEFYHIFLRRKAFINDSAGYFFEHALWDTIIEEKQYPYSPFFIRPQIEGVSGSSGKPYTTETPSFQSTVRYARFGIHLWHLYQKKFRP